VRRTFGYTLVALGLILIFLAPVTSFYVVPRVKKIPTDFQNREVAVGVASYLDPSQGFTLVSGVPIRDVRTQKGDVDASTDTVAVWDGFDSLFDVKNHHQITYSINRYTLQRVTAASVKCCGQNIDRGSSLTQLFPIGTEKKTYQFWDDSAKAAFPIHYIATETLDDATVYRFHQTVPAVKIDTLGLPGKLVGESSNPGVVQLNWMYASETDIWVEPVTGGIVKAGQHAVQWLADQVTGQDRLTVADVDAEWDPPTVQNNVDQALAQKRQLALLETGIPIFGPVIGVVLIVIGLLLARGRRLETDAA
jgi:hypothetical protein